MIRRFRLIAARDLETLCARTLDIANAWAGDWLPKSAGIVVTDARPVSTADDWRDVLVARNEGGDWCAFKTQAPQLRRVGAALLGDDGGIDDGIDSDLVADLCRRALGALGARLADAERADGLEQAMPGDVPGEGIAPGSGSVVIALEVADASFDLLLSGAITHRWLGQHEASPAPAAILSPPHSVLGPQRLRATCVLGDTELELGALASLAVGDVITLDHPLDEPLRLRFSGADVECQGYLCQAGQKNALMLSPDTAG